MCKIWNDPDQDGLTECWNVREEPDGSDEVKAQPEVNFEVDWSVFETAGISSVPLPPKPKPEVEPEVKLVSVEDEPEETDSVFGSSGDQLVLHILFFYKKLEKNLLFGSNI